MRKPLVNIPAVLGVIGIMMVIVSSWFILKKRNHDRNSLKTSGKVIDLIAVKKVFPATGGKIRLSRFERIIGYRPVIQFTTNAGDIMEFMSSVSYNSIEEHPKNSRIDVLYNPLNPKQVNVTEGVYTSTMILLLVGILFVCYYVFIRVKKSKQANVTDSFEP